MAAGENVAIRMLHSIVLRELTCVILQPAEHLADHRRIRRTWPHRQVANTLDAYRELLCTESVEVPCLIRQSESVKIFGV